MFAACFDERNVMAKNKFKVEKIRLFLERWEGHNKAKHSVMVCQQRKARCRDSDVCGDKNGDLTDERQEFAVAHGLWSRYIRRFTGFLAASCPLLIFARG